MSKIRQVLDRIYRNVTGKQALIFGIVFLVFTAIALPMVASFTTEQIGVSESPDTSFQFDVDEMFDLIESYGQDGREFYVLMRWTFDVAWPAIYTLFLVSSIAYFARKSSCKFKQNILFIPILAVLFDVLENINATILMLRFPHTDTIFAYLLMISSLLKWVFIGLSFVIVIGLMIRTLIQRSQKGME